MGLYISLGKTVDMALLLYIVRGHLGYDIFRGHPDRKHD